MAAVLIIIIVVALVLAGVVTVATAARARKPKCACFEFIGDNPYCPIQEHRNASPVWKEIRGRSGTIRAEK